VLLYYALAIYRPQYIWKWALPPEIRWSLIAAIVAILTVVLNLPSLRHSLVQIRFILLMAFFGLCLGGSYYYAMNHEIAGRQGWEYAKILIMVILSCFVVTEKWQVRHLAWMIFICLIYVVYEVNSLYLFNQRLDIYHNGYGGYDNNGAGLMLAMVIPFCYFFFQAERRWWRWGYFVCIFPAVHAVMLTYSRGAMLSAFIVGLGMTLGMLRRKALQTVGLVLMISVVILALAGPEVRKRFTSIHESDPGRSKQLRYTSWRAGIQIALDYPIFGVGLRNSNLLTKQYGCDMEGRTIHNNYIQIAADAGIPAGIIFTGLVGLTLWHLFLGARITRNQLDQPEQRWFHYVCRASFWSLATFAVGSIFLSFETFEMCYLLMLIGAMAPALARTAPAVTDLAPAVPSTSVHHPSTLRGATA